MPNSQLAPAPTTKTVGSENMMGFLLFRPDHGSVFVERRHRRCAPYTSPSPPTVLDYSCALAQDR